MRLLILTGARRDEIGGLQWSEVDFERGEIALSGARTKTGAPHVIPLTPQWVAVLCELPRRVDCPFVFSLTGNPVSGWSKAKARLDLISGVEGWRLHDIRRTVATGLQRLGISLQVVEAILGHTSGSRAGIVRIYQRHDFAAEKRQALTLWADYVTQLSVRG